MSATTPDLSASGLTPARAPACASKADRLRALVDTHHAFVWRSLRRLGLPEADVDDAAQRVFLVASRKLEDILVGRERAFLYQTAFRVAADARRSRRRRREVITSSPGDTLEDPRPGPDDLVAARRARERLDEILDSMPLELRAAFVLFELEQMTLTEIAALLGVPRGTVASRLRRARREFHDRVQQAAVENGEAR